jgi:excisionase family DNA binding protein
MSVNEEGLEITTGEAARILNISRPQLIKQLEAGALAYQLFGSHRRIRLIDVLAYRDRVDAQALAALDAMTADAEELGLYD